MRMHFTMSLARLGVVVSLLTACSEAAHPRDTDAEGAERVSLGGIMVPLTATVGNNVYRILGSYRLEGPPDFTHEGSIPLGVPSLRFVRLAAGQYVFTITAFTVWRSTNGAPEVDVTDHARLPEATHSVQVIEGQTAALTVRFEVDGEPVVVSPCDEEPDAVECPYGDLDGDNYLNEEECPDPEACVDTDGDGEPDVRDLDSDGDGTPDALENREVGTRTNPCLPDPVSPTCPAGTSIDVVTEVEETCAADECTFDYGTPPVPGATPEELRASTIELYLYPSYVPAKAGVYFDDTLTKDEQVRIQLVYVGGDFGEPYDMVIDVLSVDALYLAGAGAQSPYHALTKAPSAFAGGFEVGARKVTEAALLAISVYGDEDGNGENELVARRVVRITVAPAP